MEGRPRRANRRGLRARDMQPVSRRTGAALAGGIAGAVALAVLLVVGWFLSQRLWPDSLVAMIIVLVIFGAFGLYAGWLLGMVVFSAVRGGEVEG